ncbi:MAG: hypothetical protein ACK5CS_14515, partial [Bradyrhizobium sp.]
MVELPEQAEAGPTAAAAMRLAIRQALPPHSDGMRIGLLGGSFNPPHQAHRAIDQQRLGRAAHAGAAH